MFPCCGQIIQLKLKLILQSQNIKKNIKKKSIFIFIIFLMSIIIYILSYFSIKWIENWFGKVKYCRHFMDKRKILNERRRMPGRNRCWLQTFPRCKVIHFFLQYSDMKLVAVPLRPQDALQQTQMANLDLES